MTTIYQHFRPEEKSFIDQVLNWKSQVEQSYAPKLTDFLDPREQEILKTVIGKNHDVQWQLFGGAHYSERKRALLYPDYFEAEKDDFQLTLFQVVYPHKFVKIEHPQVLGSLMSLGLKRNKFGDILFREEEIQFIVSKEIADYLCVQLESIGRATVKLVAKGFEEVIETNEQWQDRPITASSLRLDTILASVYNLSRQKAQAYIQSNLVKVNWTHIENPAFECREGDIISVRGLGRSKVISIEGKTKKDNWKVVIGLQK
ncbi:RNA-binding protein YlmH [Cytobacillus horneckiae]|uniref:RNA-binding protein n=1 Tax=Cytobacillus horneckiae TaxID=549687 RepID=A0A2N0ZM93_9BACI|nr:RNA-binding protein [Cytobacillus horneckiae]NRG45303.1 RNA-binding protein [Bacillus sp. CRN 9]MBN6887082.1 RNA-binding protein [Cytobacillus horneckiae]MCM3178328.1 RNA-binding protein [Cytobacillus horneckiae]MEC1156933.1 RNA-binding protein [Cytobacillus horneckiae]MED2940041.1 RNA-binding protein [Cytobacillus horneckiae]